MRSSKTGKLTRVAALLGVVLGLGSCELHPPRTIPGFRDGGMLAGSTPLPAASFAALEARFNVQSGSDRWGKNVVTRKSPDHLSIFGETEAVYSILQAGCLEGGTKLVLEGYWRYAATSDAGLVRLYVGPAAVAKALCAGATPAATDGAITLTGATGTDNALPDAATGFTAAGALATYVGKFMSISHHGATTTLDYGVSENTVESFRLTEQMGADAVETDIRLTRDGIPILFHDAALSAELVQGRFCRGNIADLTFAQIRATCRAARGEPIYSLEEGLRGAIDTTTLRGAWLDVKEPQGVAPSLAVMARSQAYATAVGRDFFHVIGLADADIMAAYQAAAPPSDTLCLVDYDPAVAIANGCVAWDPRFTEGPQPDAVKAAQKQGLAVYFWTVDGVPFIKDYLLTSKPNGMITDTPGLAFYVYQQNAWQPAGGHEPHGQGKK
jgi:glycerophosphoryl diester phosphodiesterase